MKIFILGNTGMLGRYVYNYFKNNNYNVIPLNRKDIDVNQIYQESQLEIILKRFNLESDDIVINCIGMIKQRKNIDDINFIQVNSIFPRLLANVCEKNGAKMIHPSTDCVFSGSKGEYTENDSHDAEDVYGRSKSLGEPQNCCVIRTSIIGLEVGQGRSLISWVMSNKDKTINGYTNHRWNGVTCLEFSKICEKIIINNYFWTGVRHICTDPYITKYDLVKLISDIFELNISVNSMETEKNCFRDIKSIKNDVDFCIPNYKEQLIELKKFNIN